MRLHAGNEKGFVKIFFSILIAVVALFIIWQWTGDLPAIQLAQEIKGIGRSTPVTILSSDARGLRAVLVEIEQGGLKVPILEETYGARWDFWRNGPKNINREVVLGPSKQTQLKDGDATLRITAWNKNWFSSRSEFSQTFPVRTRPPSIEVRSGLLYINQGGSEIVTYKVSATAVSSGVQVGTYFFRGYQLPGGQAGDRMALFAFPPDLPTTTTAVIVAQDEIGNEARASFSYQLLKKNFRHREITVDDAYFQATVPAILAETPALQDQGELLKNFLLVNGTLRRENRQKIKEMSKQTAPSFLWEGPFMQLGNTAVEAQFADFRSYIYQGKKVDEQVHLGFDLASFQHAPVIASNAGEVVLAEYLGIFGNSIILDHGLGLQSLYSHLSAIEVKPGDKVTKGQEIGKTGTTGLAGGDHLHFSMLVGGVEVNPVEWWDPLWVQQHILARLNEAK